MSTAIAKGYDFSYARPSTSALKQAGATFVVRYLSVRNSQTSGKILTKSEADKYRAAGIEIVSNYEWYASRCLEGRAAGIADAKTAAAQHIAAGGPGARPIYFSVDVDTATNQHDEIGDYFRGVASVIGLPRTGVYGEYEIVKYLLDKGLVAYAWQTYAWSHGLYDERSVLAQDRNGLKLSDGSDVDLDTAHAQDYGQWGYTGKGSPPSKPSKPTPKPAGTVYVVQRGDTLSAIAGRYHTTVAAIVAANGITNPDLIYPGQRFRIPSATTGSARYYTVVSGDTLSAIAGRYHSTVAALVKANRIKNPDLIYPGQRLVIP